MDVSANKSLMSGTYITGMQTVEMGNLIRKIIEWMLYI